MRFSTKVVRFGLKPDPTTGAIVAPIYQTATYVLSEVGKDKGFDYTRSSNPTRETLEKYLAAIDNGKFGVSFASGMSAVDAALRLLSQGDHVISSNDVYGGVSRLFDRVLSRYGLTFSYVDTSDPEKIKEAIRPETKMIWVETPTNPLLQITDLEAVAQTAQENELLFGVDSTFATPVLLRPLEWGADFVIHSTTKYISGHNQIIGGAFITNNESLFDQIKTLQKTIGAVSSPFDCWLTILGAKTLELRVNRQSANAMEVAQFLQNHPKIQRVIYPGLPNHPGHKTAKSQMSNFGGMISFELKDIQSGIMLMNRVKLCLLAESLGAVETMITHPASMTHAEVPKEVRDARGLTDGLVRLSVGIEDVKDIIEDLEMALDF